MDVVPEFLPFLLVKSPSLLVASSHSISPYCGGKVSKPTLTVVAEEGTASEKAAAAAARRNETTKKHFHSSALPSKPQQKVADKIGQATLQDQFLICGWSPSYQTQNSTPCVPQQMSGPSGPNSPHIPTPEISPWLTLDTQPELSISGICRGMIYPYFTQNFPQDLWPISPQCSRASSNHPPHYSMPHRAARRVPGHRFSAVQRLDRSPHLVFCDDVAIQREGTWPNLATSKNNVTNQKNIVHMIWKNSFQHVSIKQN